MEARAWTARVWTPPEGPNRCDCMRKIMFDHYYCIKTLCDATILGNVGENASKNLSSCWNIMYSKNAVPVSCIYNGAKKHVQGGHPRAETKFPDFSLTKFSFSLTKILQFYDPIGLLAADKWQIPFTSSLKCTSLILQMKQIKSLNSFLAQNVLKLTSFHSLERAKWTREKINTFKNQHSFTF